MDADGRGPVFVQDVCDNNGVCSAFDDDLDDIALVSGAHGFKI